MQKYKKAFSMIELSIIILVIGILISGVVKGRNLVYKSSIYAAISLTKSSPVTSIDDLVFWVEPTLKESFEDSDLNSSSLKINRWNDISPTSLKAKDLFASGATAPTYIKRGIGGLPSLFFDASTSGSSGQFLATSLNEPTNGVNEFSIFAVVEASKFTSNVGTIVYARPNLSVFAGYSIFKHTLNSGWEGYGGGGGWNKVGVYDGTKLNKSLMITFCYKRKAAQYYFLKNGGTPSTATGTYSPGLNYGVSVPLQIGGTSTSAYFNGLISEVIIYSRALKDKEIQDVQKYLSKKYGIKI